MAERRDPAVYSIAAHRGFADALVAGLIPRYRDPETGLARVTLLLPSSRARRIVTEAFVRQAQGGLLLPRMVLAGDLDLDESLGALLDPFGAESVSPPAADPVRRWLWLGEILEQEMGQSAPAKPGLLRLAGEIAQTMDRLAIEDIALDALLDERVRAIIGDLADHWTDATRLFAVIRARWSHELALRGEVDAPERRNRLFAHADRQWAETPPRWPVVAAGITGASPALARLLKTVAWLPQGAVILPDLDLALDRGVWDALGVAGDPGAEQVFGSGDAFTHPQYHLKLLLNRMDIGRDEVRPWHRAGIAAAPPQRSRAISNVFLPPAASVVWRDLPADQRRLSGVRLLESANPEAEAQAVAIMVRQALEIPEKRVAVITPDRALAARIVAHLQRWGVAADDSGGRPLGQTAAGRLFLLLAENAADHFTPVPLLALLQHPLVAAGEGRAEWLERVRALDLELRGPRPLPGLKAVGDRLQETGREALAAWWAGVATRLTPLAVADEPVLLADLLDTLTAVAEDLCGLSLWSGEDGRALAHFVEQLRIAAANTGTRLTPVDLAPVLREAMERSAVRPAWGSHPRVVIYGLLEARMSRADLTICAGLTEGQWPGAPAPEPVLPPPVLRALGVPGGEFRIGLAAHDLAAALGSPEVVLSWANRDAAGPVLPSRFVLRVKAMLGGKLASDHMVADAPGLTRLIDYAPPGPPYPRPRPCPSAEQRDVPLAVTAIDRLRGDPYQFYASAILRLRTLDALDADPTAAWQGSVVHRVLERWHQAGASHGELHALAMEELAVMRAHPLVRSLWWPRLDKALEWIDGQVRAQADAGRSVVASECDGAMTRLGVKVFGRADRIDRLADGALAVVDYKTGKPPSATMVATGYALQLGTLGLIAQAGGFAGISGTPTRFEYWSLGKSDASETGFGYVSEPVLEGRRTTGLPRDEFLATISGFLDDAIRTWIKGDAPFEAQINPDLRGYTDYDQLMRLDEWQTRGGDQG